MLQNNVFDRRIFRAFSIALLLMVAQFSNCIAYRRIPGWNIGENCLLNMRQTPTSQRNQQPYHQHTASMLLELRGGAKKGKTGSVSARKRGGKTKSARLSATGKTKVGAASDEESKSGLSRAMEKYKKILPLTRIHITLVGVVTVLGLVLGEELAQELLALDPIRVLYGLQIWRLFSAAAFLGPPSIGWLLNGYYLFQYGSTLEQAYGTAQHFVFLCSQIVILTLLSFLTGQPFFANSLITAMLHVLSRSAPHQTAKWLIFNVPYWSLPYGLMATDILQAKSAMAALPHISGILSGHVYFFHKFVWPKMGHTDWLVPFDIIRKKLDPDQKTEDINQNSRDRAIKKRKRTKGRKLGSKK